MKNFPTIFILLFFSVSAKAQLDKRTWLVGGTAKAYYNDGTYRSTSVNNTSTNIDIEILPTVGYFLIDKLAVGLRPSFYMNKATVSNGVPKISEKRLSVGPFARFYFLNPEKQYNLLADVTYQYGVYRFYTLRGTINTFSIMAGPEIFFNESIGLEFLVGYTSRTEDVKNAYQDTKKGIQISVGLQFHLFNDESYY